MSDQRHPAKVKLTADIADDAVADALRAVEARTGGGSVAETTAGPDGAIDAVEGSTIEIESESDDPGASPRVKRLEAELAEARAMIDAGQQISQKQMERLKEANERMLRAAADLENYKKRAQKEKEELQKFGVEKLLKDLLPVLDNFDRALEQAAKGATVEAFAEGVKMTKKFFEDTVGKHGVKGFRAQGEPFDPHRHEAVQQIDSAEVPQNHVAVELVRGYTLHERLIRPAMVVVSRGMPKPVDTEAEARAKVADAAKAGAEALRAKAEAAKAAAEAAAAAAAAAMQEAEAAVKAAEAQAAVAAVEAEKQ